jgi:uncharacterized membrane protein YesL
MNFSYLGADGKCAMREKSRSPETRGALGKVSLDSVGRRGDSVTPETASRGWINDDRKGAAMSITSQRTFSERAATASLRWSSTIVFAAQLSGLWWLGTLLGGVVAGFAPATAACAAVARARLRGTGGDEYVTRDFFGAYRAGFGAANAALLPVAVVAALVASALAFAVQNGLSVLTIGAVVAAIPPAVTLGIAPAMLAHYEIRPARVPLTAWSFALRNPGLCVQLLLAASVITVLALIAPAAGLLFAAGVWVLLSTFLCLHRFAANDRLLGDRPAT